MRVTKRSKLHGRSCKNGRSCMEEVAKTGRSCMEEVAKTGRSCKKLEEVAKNWKKLQKTGRSCKKLEEVAWKKLQKLEEVAWKKEQLILEEGAKKSDEDDKETNLEKNYNLTTLSNINLHHHRFHHHHFHHHHFHFLVLLQEHDFHQLFLKQLLLVKLHFSFYSLYGSITMLLKELCEGVLDDWIVKKVRLHIQFISFQL